MSTTVQEIQEELEQSVMASDKVRQQIKERESAMRTAAVELDRITNEVLIDPARRADLETKQAEMTVDERVLQAARKKLDDLLQEQQRLGRRLHLVYQAASLQHERYRSQVALEMASEFAYSEAVQKALDDIGGREDIRWRLFRRDLVIALNSINSID